MFWSGLDQSMTPDFHFPQNFPIDMWQPFDQSEITSVLFPPTQMPEGFAAIMEGNEQQDSAPS